MSIKPPKFTNRNGQHALEYMILLTLIMAGIIIGTPYVIRSWNAQIKGWEDSVVDSMTDPLTQAPVSVVTIPGCDFVSWGSCGFGNCCDLGYSLFGSSIDCTPQQLLQRGVFNPQDCELSDPSMSFNLIARCDTNDANHCCTPWVPPSGCTLGAFGCPVDSDCGINVGCPDGQYRRTHTCDTGYTETECVADPGCNFTCGGPLAGFVPIANATFCAGDSIGLPGDRDYVVVNSCTAGTKCEFACNPPFISFGTYCSSCGNTVCDNGETCSTCPGDCDSSGSGLPGEEILLTYYFDGAPHSYTTPCNYSSYQIVNMGQGMCSYNSLYCGQPCQGSVFPPGWVWDSDFGGFVEACTPNPDYNIVYSAGVWNNHINMGCDDTGVWLNTSYKLTSSRTFTIQGAADADCWNGYRYGSHWIRVRFIW